VSARELDVLSVPLHGVQLVEASAGTGKTWTLCALLLRLLLERGLPLREVLVVSFTTAATAELRERVRRRLAETAQALDHGAPHADPFLRGLLERLQGEDPVRLRARLQDALQGFDEAAIHTIHGFAQRSLAELGFAAGAPVQLEAIQDESALRLELAQAWWRRELVDGATASPLLLDFLLAEKEDPQVFADQLGQHLRLPLARCIWPAEAAPDAALEARARAALQDARRAWLDGLNGREALHAELHAALPRLYGNVYKASSLDEAFAEWDERLDDPAALLRRVRDGSRLKLLRRDHLDDKLKKNQVPVAEHPFLRLAAEFLDAQAALLDHLQAVRRSLRARWLRQGSEALEQLKAQRGLLGFDDMLRRLHLALQQPEALAQLRKRYPAALIDEFQDTDPLQYTVFRALFNKFNKGSGLESLPLAGASGSRQELPPCCFLVGDPKQAIYKFRQADLPTYLRARDEAEAVWTLQHNQRSTPELLQALNGLFGRQPKAFLQPGLAYLPVQAGSKPKPALEEAQPGAALQLWTWSERPQAEVRALLLRQLAQDIARRLHPTQGDRLDGAPLRPGHIAVLVRSHRQAGWVLEALRAAGIEAVTLGQGSVWSSPEVAELQQLLQALYGPPHPDRQRALLASVALGLDAAQLAALSTEDQAAWAARWQAWRRLARELPLAALLHRWLQESGAAQRLLALPQGERRLTNWLHAIELLHAVQHALAPNPAALLAELARLRHAAPLGEDALLRLESDAQRVAVVTVHRSKGLEYPIVYHPFAHEGRRASAPSGWSLSWRDAEDRQVLDYAAEQLDDARQSARELEEAAEELRLHYVALTRAMLRCVLSVGPYSVGRSSKPSRRAALHALVVAEQAQQATPWPRHELAAESIAQAWREQAERPHTALRELDAGPSEPIAALPPAAPKPLAARPTPAMLPPLRWVGSFSSLIQPAHGAASLAAEVDETTWPVDDFLHFPRGSRAGDCLHAALEQAPLHEPGSWPAAIERALLEHPPEPGADAARLALWRTQLQQALDHAARTPLRGSHGPFCLADLRADRQRREWAFHLPAAHLDLTRLAGLLARHGLALPGLRMAQLRGYLRGFVDLVFEHQGRFYLADWKSNHLGWQQDDYRDPSPAVAQAGYALQALLYLLALHRHLRHSQPAYEPSRHLGGAVLLFVRGLRPDFAPGCGQWWLRPEPRLLDELEDLFSP
jgi:exodeoxyribonuclease V beta subunit